MTRQRRFTRRTPKARQHRRARFESLESRRLLTSVIAPSFYDSGSFEFTVRRDESAPVQLNLPRWGNRFQLDQSVPAEGIDSHSGRVTFPDDPTSHILYQPDPGFVGVDVIELDVLKYSPGTADETPQSESETLQIAINVVDPLIAVDDWYSIQVGESTPLSLDVLTNDTINANYLGKRSELTIQSVDASDTIDVSIAADGMHLVYTPASGFTGLETIQYTAVDDDGYTATGTAQVRVLDDNVGDKFWPEQLQQQLIQRAVQRHLYSFGTGASRDIYYDGLYRYSFELDALGVPTVASQDTSGTNNQIADVDESDRIKTDGDYLYVLSTPEQTGWMGWDIFPWIGLPRLAANGLPSENASTGENMLTVIDIRSPENPTIVAREIFADKVLSLDLHGDRLSVIGQRQGQTVVSTLDVSDAQNVDTVSTTVVDGQFKQARRVGGSLYVFTDQYGSSVPDLETMTTADDQFSFRETAQQYLERVRDSLIDVAMPSQQVFDGEGNPVGEPILAVNPLQTGIPEGHWLNILTFDTASETGGAIDWDINEDGTTVLVTPQSIYVTHTDYHHNWSEVDIVEVIDFVPEPPSITTSIDRYELQADGSVELAAEGSVPGTLKNSFSFDEYDGALRIATENAWRFGPDEGFGSSVYVLQQSNAKLSIIGAATGLAPGESIYAVRFAGDRGYVVTFRRVDPLFVLDLSEPTDPQVKGELKVPGYSQYLHVLSDTHVLGVGRDADPDTGLYQGLAVSLFDVTDAENPLLQDRYLFDGGRSTFSPFAEDNPFDIRDHHAISYFSSEGILALPYYSQNYFNANVGDDDPNAPLFKSPENSAVATFRIDSENGISTLDDIAFDSRADRAMRVGEHLYTLSNKELKVTHLTQPDGVIASLEFERQGADDFVETELGEEVTIDVTANDLLDVESTLEILAASLVDGDGEVTIVDGNRLQFKPNDGRLSPHRVQYTARDEAGTLISAITTIDPDLVWQNTRNRFDINDDGNLTPRDILNVINTIANHGATDTESIEAAIENAGIENTVRDFHFYSDTNGDDHITPDDILQVINRISETHARPANPIEFALDQPVELELNEVATTQSGELQIAVTSLLEDSRCPVDTTCIWEGQVRAELEVNLSGQTSLHTLIYRAGQENVVTVGDYQVKLQSVASDAEIGQEFDVADYRFTLVASLLS